MRILRKNVLTVFMLLTLAAAAFAQEAKNALLIANGAYGRTFGALSQPIGEAEALKAALESVGFTVTLVKDANLSGMRKALKAFKSRTQRQGGIAFFHYGGHAVQVQGINYLIPLKAELEDELDAEYNCLNVEHLMDSMKGDSNIVVLDSCRNDPFPASSHRGANTRGLAAVKRRPANSIIVYAAAAGSTAQDGVFTPILTKHITEKNKSFSDLLIQVRKEVHIKTDGMQEPGEYRQLTDPIYVAGIDKNAPVQQKVEQPAAPAVASARPSAAKKPAVKTGGDLTYSVNGVSFKMKHIDAVTDALIGDNNYTDRKGRYTNEERKVSLSAYYIGETEVTQELWQAVMDVNPSNFKDSSKNPVERVTWNDCIEFCNELTEAVMGEEHCVYDIRGSSITADFSKKGFRLPTEAEWEYAAMSGRGHKYAGCNTESQLEAYAWYDKNSGGKTHEVGKKKANKFGLYDMSGNVWEWCWDWWSESTPTGGLDPVGAASGSYRVVRGGSWSADAGDAVRAFRGPDSPGVSNRYLGLRLACRP